MHYYIVVCHIVYLNSVMVRFNFSPSQIFLFPFLQGMVSMVESSCTEQRKHRVPGYPIHHLKLFDGSKPCSINCCERRFADVFTLRVYIITNFFKLEKKLKNNILLYLLTAYKVYRMWSENNK